MDPVIYLFCLARPGAFPVPGPGLEDGRVFTHPFRDLAAVVSPVEAGDFSGPAAERRFQDLSWVGPRARRHEEVIEQAMARSSVLPARFGTLFSSLKRLEEFLETHYETVSAFLDRVAGHEEWAVRGLLDRRAALGDLWRAALERESPGLSDLSPGKRYFHERRVKSGLEAELDRFVHTACKELMGELRGCARESLRRQILFRGSAPEEVITNWAFLVQKAEAAEFRARIDSAGSALARRGLTFRLSGPWPPYSFSPSLPESGR